MVHTLRLDNYYPTPRKLVLGTNSSFGTESIKIERGAGWDGLALTATWHIPGREEPLRVALLDGDAMDVPPEVTKEAKDGVLVLAGLASGVQRASCNVEYLILEQAGVYGGADAEPTPELAAQVLEAALQAKADAEAAAQEAAEAKARAEEAQAASAAAQEAAEAAAADAAKAGPYAEAALAAQQAAEDARDKATAAQQAAEDAAAAAAASKSAADTLAAEAARAAKAAENSKAAANNAANFAGENATAAQQAAGAATAAANDAGQSASDAAASKAAAETAAKASQNAQTATAAAKEEAVKAQGAAQTAAKSAQDAQAAAEKVRDDAKTAQKGAEAARDTAAKSAEAAAKSEANAKQSADTLAESVENVVANTAAVAELKQQVKNITPDDSGIGDKPWSSKHIIDMLCPPLEESGNPVVCYPVVGYPLGVKAKWEPTQEGTGTPSPENIRPIKGRDSVTVERCGDNLLNLPVKTTSRGIVITTESDGRYHLKGTLDRDGFGCYIGTIHLPAGTYTVKKCSFSTPLSANAIVITLRKRPATGNSESWIETTNSKGSVNTGSLAKPTNIELAFYGSTASIKEGTVIDTYFEPMLVSGTTAPTTYTPYIGQTNTLTLPETVYGGEVDAVSGKGQETWETITLDGTEDWREVTNVQSPYFRVVILHLGAVTLASLAAKCTAFPLADISGNNNNYGFNGWNTSLYIRWASLSTVDALKSYLASQYAAGTPVQICYKLATPVPVPFTATGGASLPALAGVNTVITDADSVAVTGRADPIKSIAGLEAAVASIE
nr:MAG TPA: hypothetical protein [Caudoviricetes sp.]